MEVKSAEACNLRKRNVQLEHAESECKRLRHDVQELTTIRVRSEAEVQSMHQRLETLQHERDTSRRTLLRYENELSILRADKSLRDSKTALLLTDDDDALQTS